MSDDMPANPLGELAQMATMLHELYLTYKTAGFGEQEALYLVASVASGGPKAPK